MAKYRAILHQLSKTGIRKIPNEILGISHLDFSDWLRKCKLFTVFEGKIKHTLEIVKKILWQNKTILINE